MFRSGNQKDDNKHYVVTEELILNQILNLKMIKIELYVVAYSQGCIFQIESIYHLVHHR